MEMKDEIPRGNANRPSIEIAIDLIYRFSRYKSIPSKIRFGIPRPADVRPGIVRDENTFVPVIINNEYDSRFDGNGGEGFLYRRIPLSLLTPDDNVGIELPPYPFNTHDILNGINAKLHTQFTKTDIVNGKHTDALSIFEITAHPESLVWLGKIAFNPGPGIPPTARPLEDASYRATEDGSYRILEA